MMKSELLLALAPGQVLDLRAGVPGTERDLPARVVAALGGEIVLELAVVPFRGEGVLPGSLVQIAPGGDGIPPTDALVLDGGRGSRLVVRATGDMTPEARVNRRDFYRVGMRMGIADLLSFQGNHAALVRARLVDLSGGGAGLLLPAEPDEHGRLALRAPLLERRGLLHVPARVAWSRPAGRHWHIGVEFTGLREPDRDRIVGAVLLQEVTRGDKG